MLLTAKFEDKIHEICSDIQIRKNIHLSLSDFDGGIISDSKKFLHTFSGFTKPNEESWFIIEAIYQIRNILIHGNGDIKKSKIGSMKKLKFLQEKNVGVFICNEKSMDLIWRGKNFNVKFNEKIPSHIAITADFCNYALEEMYSLFLQMKNEHLNLVKGLRLVKN